MLILVSNLLVNITFFILFKNCKKFKDWYKAWVNGNDSIHFSWVLNAGLWYTLLAIGFSIGAGLCFLQSNSSRKDAPAQSRNMNNDCIFLDFFDSHDLWHFFSASAVFMAFLGLLTVDDDLLYTARDEIDVY